MPKKPPSSNDQRSNAKNPNNAAHKAARDNRSRQLNPKDPINQKGRSSGQTKSS